MKKDKYVIKRSQVPTTIPITSSIVLYLLLDNLKAPGYIWGICFTIMAIIVIGSIINIFIEKEVSVIK
jgi:amino acid transporter